MAEKIKGIKHAEECLATAWCGQDLPESQWLRLTCSLASSLLRWEPSGVLQPTQFKEGSARTQRPAWPQDQAPKTGANSIPRPHVYVGALERPHDFSRLQVHSQ